MFPAKGKYGIVAILGIISILFLCTYGVQRNIDSKERNPLSKHLLSHLPSGNYMKSVSLGFDALIADLIWVHTVVTFGQHLVTDQDFTGLYETLDTITTLDPLFNEPYHFGSIMLGMQAGQIDKSITLLKKGIQNFPDDWRFYVIIGFYYIYYKGDEANALEYFEKVAHLPHAPNYLPRIMANLYAKTGKIDLALVFLDEAYKEFRDEKIRADIEKQIEELLIEKHLIELQEKANAYKSIYSTYPTQLDALVQAGIIPANYYLEPRGGQYLIHPQTGRVISVKLLFHVAPEFKKDLDSNFQISEELRQALTITKPYFLKM